MATCQNHVIEQRVCLVTMNRYFAISHNDITKLLELLHISGYDAQRHLRNGAALLRIGAPFSVPQKSRECSSLTLDILR